MSRDATMTCTVVEVRLYCVMMTGGVADRTIEISVHSARARRNRASFSGTRDAPARGRGGPFSRGARSTPRPYRAPQNRAPPTASTASTSSDGHTQSPLFAYFIHDLHARSRSMRLLLGFRGAVHQSM